MVTLAIVTSLKQFLHDIQFSGEMQKILSKLYPTAHLYLEKCIVQQHQTIVLFFFCVCVSDT